MPAMVVVGRVDVRRIEGEIVCIMNMRIGPRRPSEPGEARAPQTTVIDNNVPAANEIKGRFGNIIALPVRSSASYTTAINSRSNAVWSKQCIERPILRGVASRQLPKRPVPFPWQRIIFI